MFFYCRRRADVVSCPLEVKGEQASERGSPSLRETHLLVQTSSRSLSFLRQPRPPPPKKTETAGDHHGTFGLAVHGWRLLRHDPLPAGLPVQAAQSAVPDEGKGRDILLFFVFSSLLVRPSLAHLSHASLFFLPPPASFSPPPLKKNRSTTPTSIPRAPSASTSSRSSGPRP